MAATSNSFEGTVVGVPSSFRIIVQPFATKAPLMTLIPACIRVPSGNDEPLSFAARDTLRKQFLGQEVHCSYVKEHARISRLSDGLEVTVSLVRAGLATCNEADRVYNDFAQHKRELIELQEAAIRRGVGLHDPCLRGSSTLRRLQPFPTRKEDPVTRQQVVKAIVTAKNTFRFSVEKMLTATSFAGYLMPSFQSVAVRLLGLKPPRSDNLARNTCQRINVRLMHRVVTVLVHGFDEDSDEFIVELTSATYKKMFGDLVSNGMLLTDRSLQLPAAIDAYNHDREVMLAEQRTEQQALREKEKKSSGGANNNAAETNKNGADNMKRAGSAAATTTASALAAPTALGDGAKKPASAAAAGTAAAGPAGLGADDVSSRPKPSPQHRPASDPIFVAPTGAPTDQNGIDIAINFGNAFRSEEDADPFSEADDARRVARMAADLVGDLLDDGSPNNAANVGTNHAAFFATPVGGGDEFAAHNNQMIGERGRILSDTNMKRFETSPQQRPAPTPQGLAAVDSAILSVNNKGGNPSEFVDSAIVTVVNNSGNNGNAPSATMMMNGVPVTMSDDEEPFDALPPPVRIEDRLPWRERLPVKDGRFRRGLVVGVPNEATMDVVEERVLHASRSGGGGGRSGGRRGGRKDGRPTVVREFFKIRIHGLGAPALYETRDSPEGTLSVYLPAKELAVREQMRRLLIGQEVQFHVVEEGADAAAAAEKADDSIAAVVFLSMKESPNTAKAQQSPTKDGEGSNATAQQAPTASAAANIRRGWMDVSHFARAVANPEELERIHEEAAMCQSSSSSDNEDEPANTANSAAANVPAAAKKDEAATAGAIVSPTTAAAVAAQPASAAAPILVEEDEEPLDMFIPRAEHSLFDFNRFNRMLQRGTPTDEELGALLCGTWAVKPNLVPVAPLVPLGDDAKAAVAAAGGPTTAVAPPAAIDGTPAIRSPSNGTSPAKVPPRTVPAAGMVSDDEEMMLHDGPPKVVVNYVSTDSFHTALSHFGSALPSHMVRQYVPGVIEEFTSPLSLSVYVPALQVQLPFELSHASVPPVGMVGPEDPAATTPGTPEKGGAPTAAVTEAAAATPTAAKDKKRGGKDRKKGKDAKADAAAPAAAVEEASAPTSPTAATPSAGDKALPALTERERIVYNDIYQFLEDSLVHRDCVILTDYIDTRRNCLVGSIAIPFAQLPHRWRSRLLPTKGLPPLITASDGSDELLIDVLHALVALGMCAITPSKVIADMPIDVISQIVTSQQNAKERRFGIWDPQCPTLQAIAKCPQRAPTAPGVAVIEPLIRHDSPRPTMRARKIIPIRRVDPFSFSFRYDDKDYVEQGKVLGELLKNSCRALPRTARVHPGDLVVICKRTVKITKKKPLTKKEKEMEKRKAEKEKAAAEKDGNAAAATADATKDDKDSDEIREEIVTYHRARITTRVVMHCCRVDFIDSNESDVSVHLREIRLPDEEGKIEAFPRQMLIAKHSFIELSDEAKRLVAARQEEEAAAAAAAKDSGKKGSDKEKAAAAAKAEAEEAKAEAVKKDRNGRVIKSRLTKAQEKAALAAKEFDDLCAFTDGLVKKSCLFMSSDYRVGDEVYGFIFEADKDAKGPHGTVPPGTVSVLRACPRMLHIDTPLADEAAVFVPFVRHLIDMVTGLNTHSIVLKAGSAGHPNTVTPAAAAAAIAASDAAAAAVANSR